MIIRIEAKDRYRADHGWLSSYHLFSFADYYDQENMNFGVLRVFNDDTVDGNNGFGKHGHRDMEIVTIVLEGELTHEDTLGNRKTIRAGDVQYMSAGMGVMHSEMNLRDEPVHLYQIWLQPAKTGLVPQYAQKNFSNREKNVLIPVASGIAKGDAIIIRSYATVHMCFLEKEKSFTATLSEGRTLFIYITKGALNINGIIFKKGDQARIFDEENVYIQAQEDADCIIIGMEGVN